MFHVLNPTSPDSSTAPPCHAFANPNRIPPCAIQNDVASLLAPLPSTLPQTLKGSWLAPPSPLVDRLSGYRSQSGHLSKAVEHAAQRVQKAHKLL
ncbi:hypothetical protein BAUCODRAFT_332829 [Baudoinia panamericana UAMH 10762]|uniref:Uncharacterized protein n=1 Tax=Baudoinia panamericana (strain UAMH 10762) TaxID=717646 RepID=M2M370_BAUPA|nr:uncharacterized protein BAUCODRAFT_332829 [Baudoinia panamericana UAMH 10762]EMC90986.1 hypothetical protein BAUCODRAFT_332829 [Baudoinia panamericana UAMH 10762]